MDKKKNFSVSFITCPNCGEAFPPEDLLAISESDQLLGDPVLGEDAFIRFRPTRFSVAGNPIDLDGHECSAFACPKCHLNVHRLHAMQLPAVISLGGAPASGKSNFMGAAISQLRKQMSLFGIKFSDLDPLANAPLHDYENKLFLAVDQDIPVEIAKTQLDDRSLYQDVMLFGRPTQLPQPFEFLLEKRNGGVEITKKEEAQGKRIAVFYDSAGEHFQPSYRNQGSTITQHMARSSGILFAYDPTQDPQVLRHLATTPIAEKVDRQRSSEGDFVRQDTVLSEMAYRIKSYYQKRDMKTKSPPPLVIVATKADVWGQCIGWDPEEPFTKDADGKTVLNIEKLGSTSTRLREWLLEISPVIVNEAESLSSNVYYVPVSALGSSPKWVSLGESNFWGISPREVKPSWVTVPILLILGLSRQGIIPFSTSNKKVSKDIQ